MLQQSMYPHNDVLSVPKSGADGPWGFLRLSETGQVNSDNLN